MTPEKLAIRFHETYERLSPDFGYQTREASAKPWADVPAQNRALMVAVCAELLDAVAPESDADWDTAVDWLLNSGHNADMDVQDAFWMLSQGLCTEREADDGRLADGTTLRQARAARERAVTAPDLLWRTFSPPGECPFCRKRYTNYVVEWPAGAVELPEWERGRTYACSDDAALIVSHQASLGCEVVARYVGEESW